jgi:putative oxidoreductase
MIPQRNAPQVYAAFRIVFGLIFLIYGLQKFGVFGGIDGQGGSAPFFSWPFGIAGIIEAVTGLLIMIGLQAKPAAFLASGEMAVAYFWIHQFHGMDLGPMNPVGLTPVQNGGVPAALFCFGFLYIAANGAGTWSADEAMGTKS